MAKIESAVPVSKPEDKNKLGRAKNTVNDTHTVRTQSHPEAEYIEKNRGLMHIANSGDYKAYQDAIDTRTRKKMEGKYRGSINAPIAGRGGVFSSYHGDDMIKHFNTPEMDKKHEDPNYSKTVYYGKMSHPDKGYFEGVYKTEEHIPHSERKKKERERTA